MTSMGPDGDGFMAVDDRVRAIVVKIHPVLTAFEQLRTTATPGAQVAR